MNDARSHNSSAHWSQGIVQELQPSYMRQISAMPLLTQAEEQVLAKQYAEASDVLHAQLRGIPGLLFEVFESLYGDAAKVRIANYFENGSFAGPEDMEVRQVFLAKAAELIPQRSPELREKGGEVFLDAIQPLVPRLLFYTVCLERLEKKLAADPSLHKDWRSKLTPLREAQRQMKEAANTLVERNLRLVISIAWHYGNSGIPLADLVQEGNIGLLRSVERFDYRLGHCFSTYASWWIRQSITHTIINHSRIIRMPANTIRQLQMITQAEQMVLRETGEMPTEARLSEETGLSPAKIRALRKMSMQPLSLQSILGEDSTLEDTIPDQTANTPWEDANFNSLKDSIRHILNTLNKREQKVIMMRFGLNNEECRTFAEISKILGLSSERVRQIEVSALQKLRAPSVSRILSSGL